MYFVFTNLPTSDPELGRNGYPLRIAVLGNPVSHSLSPKMQNAALKAVGIPFSYAAIQVTSAELPEALEYVRSRNFIGVNLTIPHKIAAYPLMDEWDVSASRLGAINTIRISSGGRLKGFNTDGPGFVRGVNFALSASASTKKLVDCRVLVIGAGGGAGQAIALQCAFESCQNLILTNRNSEKLGKVVHTLSEKVPEFKSYSTIAWEEAGKVLQEVDLIVNASALGLNSSDDFPLGESVRERIESDEQKLQSDLLVYDLVYRNDGTSTPLVQAAKSGGYAVLDGRDLLLHQGALAFEIWFEKSAPIEVMREALCSDL